jgi:hypothetical protein
MVKHCADCGREFVPSSRHFACPICRSRDICECGAPKMLASRTCIDCYESPSGSKNGNWRGGHTYHKKGYRMVAVPGHPRARAAGSYVFEHILVMEDHLGRHLLSDETVHHVNGIRDDNRIENLELWVRPQPSGIRAADAVAWAREILNRYVDAK